LVSAIKFKLTWVKDLEEEGEKRGRGEKGAREKGTY
jgi:hypothetical protein